MATETPPGDQQEDPRIVEESPGWRTPAAFLTLAALAVAFAYDYVAVVPGAPLVADWIPSRVDWLFVLSLTLFVFYVVVPLAVDRRRTGRYWSQIRQSRLALASVAYLAVFVVLGTVGPLVFVPEINYAHANQPPLFVGVEASFPLDCFGTVSGGQCYGTLAHPLGTNAMGKDMFALVVAGMRVALEVALITAAIIVPVAATVGTVAGYFGGKVDELLMGYVDIQQTVPAFLVYLLLIFLYDASLFLLVVVFGLLSWGGVARLVRSEVLVHRTAEHVQAAETIGSSHRHVLTRHILPSIAGTVLVATTRKIPELVLMEAALAYLDLSDVMLMSWGETINLGLTPFPRAWWISTVPVAFLALTVMAFSVLGDVLRDVVDPRAD